MTSITQLFRQNAKMILLLGLYWLLPFAKPVQAQDTTTAIPPPFPHFTIDDWTFLPVADNSNERHENGQNREDFIILGEFRADTTTQQAYFDTLIDEISHDEMGLALVESASRHRVKVHTDTLVIDFFGNPQLDRSLYGYYTDDNRIGHNVALKPSWNSEEKYASHLYTMLEELAHAYQNNESFALWREDFMPKIDPEGLQHKRYVSEAAAKAIASYIFFQLSEDKPELLENLTSARGEEATVVKRVNYYKDHVKENSSHKMVQYHLARSFHSIMMDSGFRISYRNTTFSAPENEPIHLGDFLNSNDAFLSRDTNLYTPANDPELRRAGVIPGWDENFFDLFDDLNSYSLKPYDKRTSAFIVSICEQLRENLHLTNCGQEFIAVGQSTYITSDLHSAWQKYLEEIEPDTIQATDHDIDKLDNLYERYEQSAAKEKDMYGPPRVVPDSLKERNDMLLKNYLAALEETPIHGLPLTHVINHPLFDKFKKEFYSFENQLAASATPLTVE